MKLKLTDVTTQNFKRLELVELKLPTKGAAIVAGKNGAGKSSLLDAIASTLFAVSTKDLPEPIRKGKHSASTELIIADKWTDKPRYIISRTFDKKASGKTGTELIIRDAENGRPLRTAKALLDEITGGRTVDPVAFAGMPKKEQFDMLMKLAGLDLSETQASRSLAFSARTTQNREVKRLEAQLAACSHWPEAPPVEVSIAALSEELKVAHASRRAADNACKDREDAAVNVARRGESIDEAKARMQALEKETDRLEDMYQRDILALAKAQQEEERHEGFVIDDGEILSRIEHADEVNAKIRENAEHAACNAKLKAAQEAADELTTEIESFDDLIMARVADADFGLEGLSVDLEKQIATFGGVPLQQAGGAEKYRVSTAIALALGGDLKVVFIHEGSALDEENLQAIADAVDEAGGMLIVAMARTGSEVPTIVIEEGRKKS